MSIAAHPSDDLHAVPRLLRRRPLVGFFVLAFAFSWLVVIVSAVLGLPAPAVIAITTVGPSFAAVVMTALLDGRSGLRRLIRRMTLRQVGVRWYLIALLGIPLVYLLATLVLPGHGNVHPAPPVPWLVEYVIIMTAGAVIGGPLFEEPGWRGFALPVIRRPTGRRSGTTGHPDRDDGGDEADERRDRAARAERGGATPRTEARPGVHHGYPGSATSPPDRTRTWCR